MEEAMAIGVVEKREDVEKMKSFREKVKEDYTKKFIESGISEDFEHNVMGANQFLKEYSQVAAIGLELVVVGVGVAGSFGIENPAPVGLAIAVAVVGHKKFPVFIEKAVDMQSKVIITAKRNFERLIGVENGAGEDPTVPAYILYKDGSIEPVNEYTKDSKPEAEESKEMEI